MKNHIKDVAGRNYVNPAEGTVDYVLLFIPNESIYGFINQEDTDLIDYALNKKVLLCSPLTLYAMLSLIYQATRNFAMEEKATEVMNLLDTFRLVTIQGFFKKGNKFIHSWIHDMEPRKFFIFRA